MRPIAWLHISDLHLKASDVWSQDVVLKAMCDDIERMRHAGGWFDFILVSGDLAFSGGATEYGLIETFLDALCGAAGVPKECVFTIPGNHDVDRNKQKMCFAGVRHVVQSQSRVDSFLASNEDLGTLELEQTAAAGISTKKIAVMKRALMQMFGNMRLQGATKTLAGNQRRSKIASRQAPAR